MAGVSYLLYTLLYRFGSGLFDSERIIVTLCLSATILFAIAVYTVLVIMTRTLTKADMALVPKGERIAKILRVR